MILSITKDNPVGLHLPVWVIVLYAFTTEDRTYQFPPPGLTLHWFSVAFAREDIWAALRMSLSVASVATCMAIVLGTLAAFALANSRFRGRESITLLFVLPIALPGLAAGSVFTFSLTLGDYIIPSVVGAPGYFIGMMVYQQQGTAGNLPLAAAFSVVPIILIAIYLSLAKRLGAFDAL